MRRRLFQRFQQGVERRRREHVDLVDDIDFVPAGTGRVGRLIAQIADVVDAVIRRRVHLDHVEDAAVVDALADLTFAAGVTVLGMQAVDSFCEDFGAGGLAGAAHAGKQVGVADTPGGDLVLERGHDGALADHILKPLRTPFAVKRTIHLRFPFLRQIKNGQRRKNSRLRSSAYGCRLTETHEPRRLRLLGSPPDLVHSGPIVQGPHPYAEPRSKRCPTRHTFRMPEYYTMFLYKMQVQGNKKTLAGHPVRVKRFRCRSENAQTQDWQAVMRLIL